MSETMKYNLCMIAILCQFVLVPADITTTDATKSAALTALEYVEKIRNSPCSGGTEEVLPVHFDHSIWSSYAEVAMRMSNLLTKILIRNGNIFHGVTDEFMFDLVRNNVDGNSLIFGSAIAVEEWTYPSYRIFCPYAYKKGIVYSHDISLNYNYLDPNTEWYNVLRQKGWASSHVSENKVTYRYNRTAHAAQRTLYQPLTHLSDGHWTLPYYDCGGGDIWMVTYSSPIFAMIGGVPVFKGIGTIDIELTNIDINQCDIDIQSETNGDQKQADGSSVDVFRGTHRCRATTKCVAVAGRGFIPGAYRCVCKDGYYYPETSLPDDRKFYDGEVIESLYSNASIKNLDEVLSSFTCLQCAEGCDTCVDASPCLYEHILPLRVTLLVLSIILMILIGLTSVAVAVYRDKKVIKSSSPIFLHMICAGAILMVCPMVVFYTAPNNVTCIIGQWPRHIGFSLAYGGLLVKTWRITAIFKVKSAKKLNLSDKILTQRLLPFIAITLAYLCAWSGLLTTPSEWLKTTGSDLKFTECSSNWWSYGIVIAQGCILLWGAYLCFVVRKAPSLFNESKYITWTIYNNIILGSFIIVAREFIAKPQGPDLIYVFDFLYVQVCVTSLVCLVFIPKLWVVYKKTNDNSTETETVTARQNTVTAVGIVSMEETSDKQIQVEIIKAPLTKFLSGPTSHLTVPIQATSPGGTGEISIVDVPHAAPPVPPLMSATSNKVFPA